MLQLTDEQAGCRTFAACCRHGSAAIFCKSDTPVQGRDLTTPTFAGRRRRRCVRCSVAATPGRRKAKWPPPNLRKCKPPAEAIGGVTL